MGMSVKNIDKQFMEVRVSEYALLRDFYNEHKERAALARIYEAERNFTVGKARKVSAGAFLKKIEKWSSK